MCKHVHESQRLLFREAVTHSLLGLLFIPDTQSMGVSQPTLKSSSLKNLLKKQVSQEFGAKQFKIWNTVLTYSINSCTEFDSGVQKAKSCLYYPIQQGSRSEHVLRDFNSEPQSLVNIIKRWKMRRGRTGENPHKNPADLPSACTKDVGFESEPCSQKSGETPPSRNSFHS